MHCRKLPQADITRHKSKAFQSIAFKSSEMLYFKLLLVKEKISDAQCQSAADLFSEEQVNYCSLPLWSSEYKGNSRRRSAVDSGHIHIYNIQSYYNTLYGQHNISIPLALTFAATC